MDFDAIGGTSGRRRHAFTCTAVAIPRVQSRSSVAQGFGVARAMASPYHARGGVLWLDRNDCTMSVQLSLIPARSPTWIMTWLSRSRPQEVDLWILVMARFGSRT